MITYFFALFPDDQTIEALRTKAADLSLASGSRARRLRPANLHLTVAFLGRRALRDAGLEQRAIDAGEHAQASPITIRLDVAQTLGHAVNEKALVLCSRAASPELTKLHQLLEVGDLDHRPYIPHVTLGYAKFALLAREIEPVELKASEFALVKRVDAQPHDVLCTWQLAAIEP